MTLELQGYNEYASNIDADLLGATGKEHYRLLAYLSTLFKGQNIFDIGTNHGHSAYALAYNNENQIYSFDIVNNVYNPKVLSKSNIQFVICNLWDQQSRQSWLQMLLDSPLIFLDVDPHNGRMEYAFYQLLLEHNYQGLLVCDDIWHFKDMRDNFWSLISPQVKYDLTSKGHWSGTGVIALSDKYRNLLPIN